MFSMCDKVLCIKCLYELHQPQFRFQKSILTVPQNITYKGAFLKFNTKQWNMIPKTLKKIPKHVLDI